MTMTDAEASSGAINELHPVVYTAARSVQQHYPQRTVHAYADEAWRWAQHHPERLERALEDEHAWTRLGRAIERYLERVGRAEKAAQGGYRVDDETYYPKSLIEMALPAVWDITHESLNAEDDTNEDGKTHLPPKRVSDPAEGGNWWATIVDVRSAVIAARLSGDALESLHHVYVRGRSARDEFEDNLIQVALRKIQRQLGGERPTACSPSCECRGLF